jgi:hypothetical protein
MAYSKSTSITSQADLMYQVYTFAVALGWTLDNYDTGNKKMSLHKGNCHVHFWWNDTSTASASYGTSIGMYQSLGYIDAATNPWAHTDDSQNGADSSANLNQERGIKNIGNGPYTSLSMHGHTDTDVIYYILEIAPGIYRHFGFGNIIKSGSWVGGEWAGGHHWEPGGDPVNSFYDIPYERYHSILLDARNYNAYDAYNSTQAAKRVGGTIHVEGLPNQSVYANTKWGTVGLGTLLTSSSRRAGRDGKDRAPVQGCFRDGFNVQQMGWLSPDITKGYLPIIPCDLYYYDFNGSESEELYYLGRLPYVGHIQMTGIDPQQALTVGADEWVIYPGVRKSMVQANNQESWNMGIIYKK